MTMWLRFHWDLQFIATYSLFDSSDLISLCSNLVDSIFFIDVFLVPMSAFIIKVSDLIVFWLFLYYMFAFLIVCVAYSLEFL